MEAAGVISHGPAAYKRAEESRQSRGRLSWGTSPSSENEKRRRPACSAALCLRQLFSRAGQGEQNFSAFFLMCVSKNAGGGASKAETLLRSALPAPGCGEELSSGGRQAAEAAV